MDFTTELPESEGGRGAIAHADIPEGHVLASIPRQILLSTGTSTLPPLFGSDWPKYKLDRGWSGLILCMLWETTQGTSSKWFDYLTSLPTTFDTPMFWDEADLQELPRSVVEKLGKEDAERDYRDVLLPAIHSRPDLFPHDLLAQHYTLEKYHVMGSAILSRSFNVEKVRQDDAMNLDEDGSSESSDDEEEEETECENAKVFYEKAHLKIISTKPIKTGEQIWNTYGDLPNAELLRRYGHIDWLPLDGKFGNPGDDVEIRADIAVSVVCQVHNLSPDALRVRIDWWLDEGEDDVFVVDSSLDIPQPLVSLVRLLIMSEEDWIKVRDSEKLPKPKLSLQTLDIIEKTVSTRLQQYSTTIEEDKKLLSQQTLSRNKQRAIMVRLGEKQLLSGCLRKAQLALEQQLAYSNKRKGTDEGSGAAKTAKKLRS